MRLFLSTILLAALFGCQKNQNIDLRSVTASYFKAKSQNDGSEQGFVADTIKIWFENKSNKPILRIKGQKKTGPWAEWDEEFKSSSRFDILWSNDNLWSVSGVFFEDNEFYELIGKPPTKTTRTFWFNDKNLISEILIIWKPGQKTSADFLEPIEEWALKNDSITISQLYPNQTIKPSKENAILWRKLIGSYRSDINH